MPLKPVDFFIKLRNSLPALEREIASVVVRVEAEQQWASHFRREGFEDRGFTPWQPRKQTDKNPAQRALLVKSGALRRAATKGRAISNQVHFTVPLVYANVHNSDDPADRQAGRGKGFTMPQRKFIGESEALRRRIDRKVQQFLNHKLSNL